MMKPWHESWRLEPRYADRNARPISTPRGDGAWDVIGEVTVGGGVEGQTLGDVRGEMITAAPLMACLLHAILWSGTLTELHKAQARATLARFGLVMGRVTTEEGGAK